MQRIEISEFGRFRLYSYTPLCFHRMGNIAIQTYTFPPYIDSFCRTKTDFQNEYPSISALCRASKFAPTLQKDDIITYITKKNRYTPYIQKHNRLVAILQVEDIYPSHQLAQQAYKKIGDMQEANQLLQDGKYLASLSSLTAMEAIERGLKLHEKLSNRLLEEYQNGSLYIVNTDLYNVFLYDSL